MEDNTEALPVEELEQGSPAAEEEPKAEEAEKVEAEGEERKETQQEQRKRTARERINEITREKHEAEREAAYWREKAMAAITPATAPGKPAPPPGQPKLSDFESYEEYVGAITDWTVQSVIRERDAAAAADLMAKEWAVRQDATRDILPDYDEVLSASTVRVASFVTDSILSSDRGPEVAYHLAKNPAIAKKLNGMTPLAAAREIGRIEAALEKPASQQRGTNTPPPPATTSRPGTTPQRDLSKLSMQEYIDVRRKQGARW